MCYEKDINLKVLDCLAAYFKINIIYFYGNVMFKMLWRTRKYVLVK